jgi:AcrR family transcriptional regulator
VKDTVSTTAPLLGRPAGSSGIETRQRIIEAAMRCVAEVGYSRATIRRIAKDAQMTSGSLYHYFPNKTELIEATFNEVADIVNERFRAAARSEATVLDRLTAILDEGERITRDYPYAAAFERAIRAEGAPDLLLAENAEKLFGQLRGLFAEIIEQAKREGALAPGVNAQAATDAVFALIRGLEEHSTAASPRRYRATVHALKLLLGGALFDYSKLS